MSSQVQTPEDSTLLPLMLETYSWGEASVEPDAIEDIFRLFITEEVKHDADAGPRSAEQPSANPDRSNASCGNNKTESMSEQRMDPESTIRRGQKQATAKEMPGDSHHRIRRPWSGSRRSQPSFLNPDVSSIHLTHPRRHARVQV
ncbi:hypothetical protein XANCAGTX0491_008275 [Xanthoria calcicola]